MKEMMLNRPEMIPKLIKLLAKRIRALEKAVKYNKEQPYKKLRCSSNLKKCELAQMFYILMDEGIFFFDEFDDVRNRSKMQNFIEKNFSYKGDGGEQMAVKSVSREFSEAKGYTYGNKQGRLLARMIQRLEIRKQSISHIHE